MKQNLWVLVTFAATLFGFLAGYSISSYTGTEPGFFEAVETGSYGGSSESETTKGVDAEFQEYYKNLTAE